MLRPVIAAHHFVEALGMPELGARFEGVAAIKGGFGTDLVEAAGRLAVFVAAVSRPMHAAAIGN